MIKKYSPLWMRMKHYNVEVMIKIILWRPLRELEYYDMVMGEQQKEVGAIGGAKKEREEEKIWLDGRGLGSCSKP